MEQWVRIDVCSGPVAFRIGDDGDGEVQMIIAGSGVAGIADVGDDIATVRKAALGESLGIALKVRVIVDEPFIRAQLVDGDTAFVALEEFNDAAISGGHDGRSARCRNINGIVNASFRARLAEGIPKLLAAHTCDRNQERRRTVGGGRSGRCRDV